MMDVISSSLAHGKTFQTSFQFWAAIVIEVRAKGNWRNFTVLWSCEDLITMKLRKTKFKPMTQHYSWGHILRRAFLTFSTTPEMTRKNKPFLAACARKKLAPACEFLKKQRPTTSQNRIATQQIRFHPFFWLHVHAKSEHRHVSS